MTLWQELSGRFAENKWFDSLDRRVLSQLEDLPVDKPILVACSGGADSVFLTLALFSGLVNASGRLHLVHFNHGMRGSEADSDAKFVRQIADGLGLSCHIGQPGHPLSPDEAALREARYAWMVNLYQELDAGGLCLGHHADDVVESLLMAVLTGSGPAGMASPVPVKRFSDGHVRFRPMLSLRRDQILQFLREADVPWRDDTSNLDTGYTRNWLRLECIPSLRERISQDIYSGTRRTRELMEECLITLDESAQALGVESPHQGELDVACLFGQSRALVRRALMSWWMRHYSGEVLGKGSLEVVIGLIVARRTGESVAIGKGQALHLDDQGVLRIARQNSGDPVRWSAGCHWNWKAGPVFTPPGDCLMARREEWDAGEKPYRSADPKTTAWIDWNGQTCWVRQWQAGDRYQPLGSPGSRKLQDMFVDAKLSAEQKRNLPVLLGMNGEILWVPGFPPAQGYKLLMKSKSALKLTYISQ